MVDGGEKGRVEIALAAAGTCKRPARDRRSAISTQKDYNNAIKVRSGRFEILEDVQGLLEMCRLQNWQTPHLIQPPARPRIRLPVDVSKTARLQQDAVVSRYIPTEGSVSLAQCGLMQHSRCPVLQHPLERHWKRGAGQEGLGVNTKIGSFRLTSRIKNVPRGIWEQKRYKTEG